MDPSPSLLLGTPYILSQQPTRTTPSLTPSLCQNLTLFKSLLRTSRAVDDSIILRLNRADALSRRAAEGRAAGVGERECEGFWRELLGKWEERGAMLGYCEGLASGQVKEMRVEERLSADRGVLGRGESEQEVVVSPSHTWLSSELTCHCSDDRCTPKSKVRPASLASQRVAHSFLPNAVESIIRARSLALFASRCPAHSQTPAPPPLPDTSAPAAKRAPLKWGR
mgnify:CR=1 FL=1